MQQSVSDSVWNREYVGSNPTIQTKLCKRVGMVYIVALDPTAFMDWEFESLRLHQTIAV